MSSGLARIGGGIIGAAIGFYVGGPAGAAYGFSIGSTLGGLAVPGEGPKTEGPRLDDLKAQTSSYGAAIPIVYGAFQLAGNVIWLENNQLKETKHKKTTGGKGGPTQTQTSYTYSATFAVGLCEGPIAGVRRIWADAILIYDGGDTATAQTVVANNSIAEAITIYPGSNTQLPDPRIQADRTTAPAYRNLAYIVFEDLQLEKFGNRIPNIRAEVLTAGSVVHSDQFAELPKNIGLIGQVSTVFDQGLIKTTEAGLWDGQYGWFENVRRRKFSLSGDLLEESITSVPGYGARVKVIQGTTAFAFNGVPGEPSRQWNVDGVGLEGAGASDNAFRGKISFDGESYFGYFYGALGLRRWSSVTGRILATNNDLKASRGFERVDVYSDPTSDYVVVVGFIDNYPDNVILNKDLEILWTGNEFSLGDFAGMRHNILYGFSGLDLHLHALPDMELIDSFSLPFMQYDSDYISAALTDNILQWGGNVFPVAPLIAKDATTLASVISDLCDRAGLPAADYNTSALTDQIRGYAMTRPAPLKSLIAQLRPAFRFDLAEIDYKLRFIPRGGSLTATLTEADLAAHEPGQSRLALIEHSRALETELPRQVSLRYLDVDMDYEQGVQYATRLVTDAVNDQVIDLPVVFSADEAAQTVDSVLAEAWLGRDTYRLQLAMPWARLTPGDRLDVPLDGGAVRVRITQIDDGKPGLRLIESTAESAAIYSSAAVGQTGEAPTVTLSIPGPTALALLDAPLLRDQDDTAGIYLAAAGYLAGWSGAVLYRSSDGGSSYTALDPPLLTEAVLGSATNKLANGDPAVWDRGSSINLRLIQGELSSTTEINVLNGANTIAIGADGRWEIAAFRDATLESDGTYTLTYLLRGLRGTEWATSQHAVGDTVVLLTTDGSVQDLALSLDAIGLARLYKSVSIGNSLAQASSESFTFQNVRQMPLSPVHVSGLRNGSSDLTLSWIRRTRVGGEWRDGTDVPLGEASEAYEIDILNGSTVVRTISAGSTSATYTAAEQTTDFGSAQSSIDIVIYQISANVGRGYAAEATL